MVCNTCVEGNRCGNRCGEGHHRHFLLRLVIGIAILVIVFKVGVEVGEFKGMFEGPSGERWMHGYSNDFNRPVNRQQMMYYGNQASPTPVVQ